MDVFYLMIIPTAIVDESILFLNSHRSVSDTHENTPSFIPRYIKFLACFTYTRFLDLSYFRGGVHSHDEDKPRRTDANMATRAQINPRMKSDSQQTFNLSPLSQVRCWQRPQYLTKTHIGPQERDKLFVSAVNAANLVSHHFKFKSTAALRGSEKMCVHEMRGERERER